MAFMKVKRPKTMRRGLGRVPHLRIENVQAMTAMTFLQKICGPLDSFLSLCPLSASAFRNHGMAVGCAVSASSATSHTRWT